MISTPWVEMWRLWNWVIKGWADHKSSRLHTRPRNTNHQKLVPRIVIFHMGQYSHQITFMVTFRNNSPLHKPQKELGKMRLPAEMYSCSDSVFSPMPMKGCSRPWYDGLKDSNPSPPSTGSSLTLATKPYLLVQLPARRQICVIGSSLLWMSLLPAHYTCLDFSHIFVIWVP